VNGLQAVPPYEPGGNEGPKQRIEDRCRQGRALVVAERVPLDSSRAKFSRKLLPFSTVALRLEGQEVNGVPALRESLEVCDHLRVNERILE
jgi:hypothetical protein